MAALHLDEHSPHVHVLMLPLCRDGKLAWGRLQAEMTHGAGARAPRNRTEQIAAGSAFQDRYHEARGIGFRARPRGRRFQTQA